MKLNKFIIDDDGNAIINVGFKDVDPTKVRIFYDLYNHEITIFSIK